MQTETEPIDAALERANAYHFYADIGWMAFAFAMEWYYLQVYAIRLGATPLQLGVLTSGRALLMVAGSGLAARWQNRFNNAIRAIGTPLLIARILLYFSIALVPLLPGHQVDAMLVLVLLSAIPTGISQGIYLGMMPAALSKANLATVVARRSVLMNALILGCMVIVGQLLTWLPLPVNYQVGFVIAFAVSCVSWWHIQKIRVPDSIKVDQKVKPSPNVWKFGPFRRFMIVVVAINLSVFMAASLTGLQLVRGLNASDAWISVFGIIEMAAGALFTLRMDRLIGRFGTRSLIIVTTLATAFQPLILALTPILPPFVIASVLFGAGWFAVNVLLYNRLVELVPHEDMTHYAAAYQMAVNATLFMGPLIGTILIENVMSIPAALLLIAGLRFFAGFLAWGIKTEPEPKTAPALLEVVGPL